MSDGDRKYSKQLIGKTIVSKTGKKFGEVGDIEFEMKTGEIINLLLKNPTGYCEGLELEKSDDNLLEVPFSSVLAIGDYVVVSEEDII